MDNMTLIIVLLVLASMASTGIMIFAARKSQISDQAIKTHVEAKSWQYTFSNTDYAYARKTEINDPKDNWTLTIYVATSPESSSVKRFTEWHCSAGKLENGVCILGPSLPAKTVKMINQGSAGPFGKIIKQLMFQFTRGMEVSLDECTLVESTSEEKTGAVLATKGNEHAVDVFKNIPELEAARAGKNEMEQPVVFRDTKGIRIRLRSAIKKTDEIDQLVALGLILREKLDA